MALAIDASTPVFVVSGSSVVTTLTTASFTPPVGSLLVVVYANANAVQAQVKPTNTGGTVSWDAAVFVSELANSCSASIWLGTVTVSASMTVTQTIATGRPDWGFGPVVVTGQAASPQGTTGVNTNTAAAPSKAITTAGANSLVLGAVANFSNATVGTSGSGQSQSFNAHAYTFSVAIDSSSGWAQYLTAMNLGAGATATIDDTGSVQYSMVVGEILAAVTAVALPELVMAPMRR